MLIIGERLKLGLLSLIYKRGMDYKNMISKSSSILIFLMIAAGAFCLFEESMEAAQHNRNEIFKSISDPSKSIEELQGDLNTLIVKHLTLIPEPIDNFRGVIESVFFEVPVQFIKSVKSSIGSIENLKAKVEEAVNAHFGNLDKIKEEYGKIKYSVALEQEVQRLYFLRPESILSSEDLQSEIKKFFFQELEIQMADIFEKANGNISLSIQIPALYQKLFNDKMNAFVDTMKLNIPSDFVDAFKSLKQLNEFYKEYRSSVIKFLSAFIFPVNVLEAESRFMNLAIQTGHFTEEKDIKVIGERVIAIYDVLVEYSHKYDVRDILLNHLDSVSSWDATLVEEKQITDLQSKHNASILKYLANVAATKFEFIESAFDRLKQFVLFRYNTFLNDKIYKTLSNIVAGRSDLEFNREKGLSEQLFFLDLLHYGSYVNSENDEEALLTFDESQIFSIINHFDEIVDVDFKLLEIFGQTKNLFIAKIFSFEDNTDFFKRLYLIVNDLFAAKKSQIDANWPFALDKYFDFLYTQSNDSWVQENYFKLKMYNAIILNGRLEGEIQFLEMNEHTVKTSFEFTQNEKNSFFTGVSKKIYNQLFPENNYKSKNGAVLISNYSGKTVNSLWFNFLAKGETKIIAGKEIETHGLNLKGVNVNVEMAGGVHVIKGVTRENQKDTTVPQDPKNSSNIDLEDPENKFLNRKGKDAPIGKRPELQEHEEDEKPITQPVTENPSNVNTNEVNDLGLLLRDPEDLQNGTFEQNARDELKRLRNIKKRANDPENNGVQDDLDNEIEEDLEELDNQNVDKEIKLPVLPSAQGTISRSISKTSVVDIDESQQSEIKELDDGVNEEDPKKLNSLQRNGPNKKPLNDEDEDDEEKLLEKLRQGSPASRDNSPAKLNQKSSDPKKKNLLLDSEEEDLSPVSESQERRRRDNDNVPEGLNPNKIAEEQRKNIVNVLRGQLTPEQLTRFENSDILKVIERPEFDEENGVEIQYVYVQVVNRNSPCYKKIYGQ